MSASHETLIQNILSATADEFQSRQYLRNGNRLTLSKDQLLQSKGLYAEVEPYSLYRRYAIFLIDQVLTEEAKPNAQQMFGVVLKDWMHAISIVNGACRRQDEKTLSILKRIQGRAGLNVKTFEAYAKTPPPPQKIEQNVTPAITMREEEIPLSPPYKLTIKQVFDATIGACNQHYDRSLPPNFLFVYNRGVFESHIRHIAIFAAYKLIPREAASLSITGREIDRDHTTVLHAIRNISIKIVNGDKNTISILEKLGASLPILQAQSEALMSPDLKSRFKKWADLGTFAGDADIRGEVEPKPKAPASSQSPALP